MITAQEAIALGCTSANNSCPSWLSGNYWTMTVNSNNMVIVVNYYDNFSKLYTVPPHQPNTYKIRAVIEINRIY